MQARSCKRSDTLFQKSLHLFLTWRDTSTASQLTSLASQKSKDLNKVPLLLQDLGCKAVSKGAIGKCIDRVNIFKNTPLT